METRNLILSLVVATAVFLIYMQIVARVAPRTPVPASAPVSQVEASRGNPPPPKSGASPSAAPASTPAGEAQLNPAPLAFTSGDSTASITIGGAKRALAVTFTPVGAAISDMDLTSTTPKGRYVHRLDATSNEPYDIVSPVQTQYGPRGSFETAKVWVTELGNQEFDLSGLVWERGDADDRRVVFTSRLHDSQAGKDLLRLDKRYELHESLPLMSLQYAVENLSDRPLTVTIAQDGPLGLRREDLGYDMRKVVLAERVDNQIEIHGFARGSLTSKPTLMAAGRSFAWAAVADKYFSVFFRCLPAADAGDSAAIQVVTGLVADESTGAVFAPSDLGLRMFTGARRIEAGRRWTPAFEIHAGPKDRDMLKRLGAAYVDHGQIGYDLAADADRACMCTFGWLTSLMSGLLRGIHFLVRNYGIAIIVLVLIVRGALHPLAVFQQKSMVRMQESMSRIQPKMNELKQKHANDRVKLNQEMMSLMAQENVNPAANLVMFIPLFIQVPILGALWQALHMDIELRLAPFDGWWIRDLSAPDSLVRFGGAGLTIPILGWLPLIGGAFQNVASLNLLPLLMGVVMLVQQRFMPKPQLQPRPEGSPSPAAPPSGMTPEEQMRQQQMIGNMMAIMFPVMMYRAPSGLILYWTATTIFGIFESIRIRKQIALEKERRAAAGPLAPKPSRPSWISRWMKRMAEQAEQLQRRADHITHVNEPAKKRSK